jgi:hypothetical protein
LGVDTLDNLVSRSSRSSSPTPLAPLPPPPSASPPMAELTIADLAALITKLTTTVETLQTKLDTLEQRTTGSSSLGPKGPHGGEHHNDRPPHFQKMDFPKFDGKSDPLAFINQCESYFHQQRIVEEEKVWMASYNLEAGAQPWFMQIQHDEGTPPWRRFTELLNTRFGPPLRSNPLGRRVPGPV